MAQQAAMHQQQGIMGAVNANKGQDYERMLNIVSG